MAYWLFLESSMFVSWWALGILAGSLHPPGKYIHTSTPSGLMWAWTVSALTQAGGLSYWCIRSSAVSHRCFYCPETELSNQPVTAVVLCNAFTPSVFIKQVCSSPGGSPLCFHTSCDLVSKWSSNPDSATLVPSYSPAASYNCSSACCPAACSYLFFPITKHPSWPLKKKILEVVQEF